MDVAIRRNDFAWPAGIATERLGDEKMGAVQIPALAHFRRLHSHSRPEAWNVWLQHGGAGAEMAEDMYFEHFLPVDTGRGGRAGRGDGFAMDGGR